MSVCQLATQPYILEFSWDKPVRSGRVVLVVQEEGFRSSSLRALVEVGGRKEGACGKKLTDSGSGS